MVTTVDGSSATMSFFLVFVVALILCYLNKDEPLSPGFWMPPFIALYGSWYALSLMLGTGGLTIYEVKSLNLTLLALLSYGVPVLVRNFLYKSNVKALTVNKVPGESLLVLAVFALMLLLTIYTIASGAASKRGVVDGVYADVIGLSVLFILFHFFIIRLSAVYFYGGRSNYLFYAGVALSFFIVVVLGERNFFFSLVLVSFLLYASRLSGNKAFSFYLVILLAMIVLMPLSQIIKAVFLSGSEITLPSTQKIFEGEFYSQGRNLVWILQYPPQLSGSEVLIKELLRGGSFSILGSELEGMSRWFNRDYRHDLGVAGTSGWGFSIIASGYMWAGVSGVIAYFFLISVILNYMFEKAKKSNFWASWYLAFFPITIYVMRQDLSYFIGDLIKYFFISFALVYVYGWVIRRSVGSLR